MQDEASSPLYRHANRRPSNMLGRLLVLRHTLDRRRLHKAWRLAKHQGPRVLWTQLLLHIAYRSRLLDPRQGNKTIPSKPYIEEPWPADRPLVSVVIPCFNYGAFVADAIGSVRRQTFNDIEIIVVEGGSTDGTTRHIVQNLHCPNVTTLYRDEPHRVGDNRNFGIQHARGKYICCLDADDMLKPTYIEKAVFILEHFGYDVVSTAVQRFGAVDETYQVLPEPELSDLLEGNQVATCAVFRRSYWELAGGYQDSPPGSVFLHEDWRFWIRLACHGARFCNIVGEELFLYRAHVGGSLSTTPDLLPNEAQGKLICQAEQALISQQALDLSHQNAQQHLRSVTGHNNMLHALLPVGVRRTLLVAMPFLILGGAERLLSEVLRHLYKSGYRLVLITTLPAPPELGDTTAWFEPFTSEIYHLPRFLSADKWQDFLEYILAAKRVDILWIVGSAFLYEALPNLTRRHPALLVVDLLFNTVAHTINSRLSRGYVNMNIVESDLVRHWLIEHGEPAERVRVITSGVDLQQFAPVESRSDLRARLGLPTDAFIVGFSGRLSQEKAPQMVLRIAAKFDTGSPVRFLITGTGPLEGALRDSIRKQKLEHRVQFVGVVPDVRDYIGCYDVLLLPSEIDGRPTVVLEALAMGVPVIASSVGGVPDLICHGETGFLCEPGDVTAFARYITEVLENPQHHRLMRAAARRFAEERLGIDGMVASYADVFERLLQSDGARVEPA